MNHFDFHSPPTSPPSSDQPYSADGDGDGDASPQSDETQASASASRATSSTVTAASIRRRRKRVAIELPPNQAEHLNKTELKKLKNRIAAARARERTQKQVEALEATVAQLWRENQHQQAVIAQLRSLLPREPGHNVRNAVMSISYQDMLSLSQPAPYAHSATGPLGSYGQRAHHAAASEMPAGMLAELNDLFQQSTSNQHQYQYQHQHQPYMNIDP